MRFPPLRIVVGTLLTAAPVLLLQNLVRPWTRAAAAQGFPIVTVIASVVLSLLALLFYALFVRIVEKRQCHEVAAKGSAQELATGTLLGVGLMSATVGVLWILGCYKVVSVNLAPALATTFAISILSGVIEELLLRGLVFRIVEESLGTWISLALSALLFGFLHITNANATIWSSVAIALEAGLLLGAAYVLTRRLWLAIGIHFGWNFAQGGLFGVAISGNKAEGLLKSETTGAEWLTGGSFGVEGSVIAVVFCVSAFALLIWLAARRGHILPPKWMRPSLVVAEAGIPS